MPAFAAPPVLNRPYSIEADVEIANGDAAGVLVAQGGDAGGYAFYVEAGRLRYVYNYVGRDQFELASPDVLPEGRHALRYEFEPTGAPDFKQRQGGARPRPALRGRRARRERRVPAHDAALFELEGLSCGYDFGAPAADGYEPPFAFNGTLHSVTFDVSGELIPDDEAALARMMAQQ